MLTRRNFVGGALAAGVLLSSDDIFSKASQPATAVNFDVPAHACDCHTHYYGDPQKFPLSPKHINTPEGTLPEEMAALHRALHIERVVIVTPSAYGTDNSSTLYGMKARGATARGIAVVDGKTPDSEFESLTKAGFRGARIVSGASGPTDPASVRPLYQWAAERFKPYSWNIELYTNLAVISAVKDLVLASPLPTVFDHLGGIDPALGLQQPGFADLLELIHSGKAYMKLSAAYRASTKAPDYRDVTPYAKAFIEANPDRMLWGSDWPHPDSNPYPGRKPSDIMRLYDVDDGILLNQLAVWAPDSSLRKKILVDNPARLYGF
ncbi:MAG TPA: amidohydrolase family protein [Candidatus Acidoferrales bacterium]|nr:amidohydrolase family protein [Candidatus Acidoferrales bacterium]